jgi:CheY-like chemotaxis protein/HPt (histidine-containing phosphotransfer) domain-containing protein
MQKTATAPAQTLPSLLAKASQVEWDRVSQHPQEFEVENLRRRGVDVLKINWTDAAGGGRSLLGMLGLGGASQPRWTMAFIDKQIRIEDPASKNNARGGILINFTDVTNAEYIAGSGKGKHSLRISYKDRTISVGYGLSEDSLKWLRDRVLLETAGLVWKPLFNVGKRTTRATSNPDDQTYHKWQAGPNRLVALFLEHAPSRMHNIEDALPKKDLATVRQNAHWLKSSSAAVGASLLSELFQRLEIDIDIKSDTEVEGLATHISSEFRKVETALARVAATDASESSTKQTNAGERPGPATDGPLAGVKVLLVEDSLVNQELALDCLHETGCTVSLANDGREAVTQFSAESFDIILMDCQMSGMDGFHATRIIRDLEFKMGRTGMPIIALTAHALKGDRDVCLAAGMSDYISKPFVPEELVGMIKNWLGHSDAETVADADTEAEAASTDAVMSEDNDAHSAPVSDDQLAAAAIENSDVSDIAGEPVPALEDKSAA